MSITLRSAKGTPLTSAEVDQNFTELKLTSGTETAATGAAVTFTGIPSWAQRVTIIINRVSTAAAGGIRIRIGTTSGIVSTGYDAVYIQVQNAAATTTGSITDGIAGAGAGDGATEQQGVVVLYKLSGNTWQTEARIHRRGDSAFVIYQCAHTLADYLYQVSVLGNGTNLDSGTINIMYE